MQMMFNPYIAGAIVLALLLSHGWALNQGRHLEQWQQARRIEATNKKIREVVAREEALAAKEDEARNAAFNAAAPVLLKAGKCEATPEVAAALSAIR